MAILLKVWLLCSTDLNFSELELQLAKASYFRSVGFTQVHHNHFIPLDSLQISQYFNSCHDFSIS